MHLTPSIRTKVATEKNMIAAIKTNIIATLSIILMILLIGCAHKPAALQMPHTPPVTTDRPGTISH